MHAVPLFAARGKLPALEHRHLVRELVDLELLVLQLVIVAEQCVRSGRRQIRAVAAHPSRRVDRALACVPILPQRLASVNSRFQATRIVACAPMRHHGKPITSACSCSWLIATC